jgi:hypothetical protein
MCDLLVSMQLALLLDFTYKLIKYNAFNVLE